MVSGWEGEEGRGGVQGSHRVVWWCAFPQGDPWCSGGSWSRQSHAAGGAGGRWGEQGEQGEVGKGWWPQ